MLTAEEERALFAALAEHDETAFERLVQANLRLVLAVASRYQWSGIALPDLVGLGNLALLRLLRSFSLEQGVSFGAYATIRLKGVMLNAIRDYANLVRLPHRQHEALMKLRKVEEAADYSMNIAALAQMAGVEQVEVSAWLNALQAPLSIDDRRVLDGDVPLAERLADDDDVAGEACTRVLAAQAREIIATLPAQERAVLTERYDRGQSVVETAKAVGLPRMTAWHVEQRALATVRRAMEMGVIQDPMSGEELEDYDYLGLYPDVTAVVGDTTPALAVPQAPPKGKCEDCANHTPGVRYCAHSGHTIGTDKALKWCVPAAKGYIPKAARS